ncbi:hypothetical protein JW756_00730 [Candidatus Woesearchaeota archaeon]|nr:hypothetical protein [Candidatus Woesearchaeota archaeon]
MPLTNKNNKNNLEGFIKAQMREITEYHTQLQAAGRHLAPMVLKHFNQYVENVINPKLPQGYILLPSEHVFFGDRLKRPGFEITTGSIQTPQGNSKGPFEFEAIIMDLFHEYQAQTPWVTYIDYGFYLSK